MSRAAGLVVYKTACYAPEFCRLEPSCRKRWGLTCNVDGCKTLMLSRGLQQCCCTFQQVTFAR